MDSLTIKFHRSDDYAIETYGPAVHRELNKLVGGEKNWDTSRSHGIAKLGRTRARVERHEDGPEIVGLLIENLPDYITAISALITLWWNRPKKRKLSTNIKLEVGNFKMEGPVEDLDAAKRMIGVLQSFGKKV